MPDHNLNRSALDAPKLLALHHGAEPLVLPNAWDAMSAAIIEAAGASAVATSSAGVSWALGVADGQRMTLAEAVGAAWRIIRAVSVPVSVDFEAGYGDLPDDVSNSIRELANVGAAGINLEDASRTNGGLFTIEQQCARIAAARSAAGKLGIHLVINARTDVFLSGDRSLDNAIERGRAYAAAGADCVFVPGLADLEAIARVVSEIVVPINILTGPGGPTVSQLAAVGVKRISVGTQVARLAYAEADRVARELLTTGTIAAVHTAIDGKMLNTLANLER